MTKIEWTQRTWNPVVGCSKVSAGCKHCYAERMHARLNAMHLSKYAQPFGLGVQPWPEALEEPFKWRQPSLVFVNSMSDLFGLTDFDYLYKVFTVMYTSHHTYQVLTKRSFTLNRIAPSLPWSNNIWMGVSVEDQFNAYRVQHLAAVRAAGVRFLSVEPMLGPLILDLTNINWVIVGGESGPGARPFNLDWARSLRDQCLAANVPFFLKQLGGVQNKKGGNEALLDGQLWHQWPVENLKR